MASTSNAPKFDWYNVVSGEGLEQGDLLKEFPTIVQPLGLPTDVKILEGYEVNPRLQVRNVIVMTQSCDFWKLKDHDLVTLCPYSDYSHHHELFGHWKELKDGRRVNAHLLNECTLKGHEFEHQIINLSENFSVPYEFVKRFAESQGDRIRLLPPYREHLSQAFARRFMRVGLPADLDPKDPYKNKAK